MAEKENPAGDPRQAAPANANVGAFGDRMLRPLTIACLTGWGLFLGVIMWQPHVPSPSLTPTIAVGNQATQLSIAPPSAYEPDLVRTMEPATRGATLHELKLIDLLLLDGNAAQAIFAYSRMHADSKSPLHDQLRYRMAVARELLGQADEAGEAYRRLVSTTIDPHVALAAKIGQARNWLRADKSELARPILAAAAADPAVITNANSPLAAEIAHMLALAHMRRPASTNDRLLRDDGFVAVMPNWRPADLLSLADKPRTKTEVGPETSSLQDSDVGSTESNATPPLTFKPELKLMYRYADDPAAIQLVIHQRSQPMVQLLDGIARVSETKIKWSATARDEMQNRHASLYTPNVNLAVAMDLVLAWVNLVWEFDTDTIHIRSAEELPEEKQYALRLAAAERLARQALASHSGHLLAPFTYLELGNIHFQRKAYSDAISVYDKIQAQYDGTNVAIIASANAAKALLLDGQHQLATERFMEVADGTHGDTLQSIANVYAGRLMLEAGDPQSATRPLMRAVSTSSFGEDRVIPLITLASCYLIADNPHAAAQALMEGREILRKSKHLPTADLLSSLAGFRAATDSVDTVQRGRGLIRSLGNVEPSLFFGSHLYLLHGQALQSVGLAAQMEIVYKHALDKALPIWVQDEIRERLVTYFIDTGKLDAARDLLFQAEETGGQTAAVTAAIRLAELEWSQNQVASCLEACRTLLDSELSTEQQSQVLQIMGRVYESQQDYENAALCYAGMLPKL